MIIKILGSGCAKCKKLEANAREAIKEIGIDARVEKVQEIQDIMEYNVMQTPALVVDEEVVVKGKVASVEEIRDILN